MARAGFDDAYLTEILKEVDMAPPDSVEIESEEVSLKRKRGLAVPGITLRYFDSSDMSDFEFPRAKKARRGLTLKQLGDFTDTLMRSSGDTASEGLGLFCAGLSEGRHILSKRLLEEIDLAQTKFVCFSKYGVKADLFLQCVFQLHGCSAVQFSWEEESVEVMNKKMPYKAVAQFVVGTRVHWDKVPLSAWGTADAKRETRVTSVARLALKRGLSSETLLSILQYSEQPSTLPIAIYWKGYRPRYRAKERKVIASVRSYPPPWRDTHEVHARLKWLMQVMGLSTSSNEHVEEFFTMLICLVSNTAVLTTEGKWLACGARVAYTPVETVLKWTQV